MVLPDYEKLGVFYLGRPVDRRTGEVAEVPFLYDSNDLLTHAVVVGMTGSGKTGLGVGLLEEAVIDGIPAIAIDPKGDLGNLALAFPQLRAEDFAPWIDPGEAERQGVDTDTHAASVAELWRHGLAKWDQTPDRIARFRDAAEVTVFTPGSRAGTPINVLRSFGAPAPAVREDADALRDRVVGTVTGLLALLGIDADPLRSREHILVSTLLAGAWREGTDLDLADIIRGIQDPPFKQVGVFDLETFYPADDRLSLAMTLNNLLASPGFGVWMEGEPLDVGKLLFTPAGKPRLSVLSIAHLSEAERMFFVTLLLEEVLSWVRGQSGTRSLRALLYMDEIFGYFPPTANPPSKKPMLSLLKQARAYGLGVVLATQNPVDLDYKGLSNTGTWFLGRLQTERDKLRILDGLEGASSVLGKSFDRQATEALLSGLGKRTFLVNNVHEDGPVLFRTRWALSYLAGPLTREQIKTLTAAKARAADGVGAAGASVGAGAGAGAGAGVASAVAGSASDSTPARAEARAAVAASRAVAEPEAVDTPPGTSPHRPITPPEIDETFVLEPRDASREGTLVYRPGLLARATLHYADARLGLDEWTSVALLAPLTEDGPTSPWDAAVTLDAAPEQDDEPRPGAAWSPLPREAVDPSKHRAWAKMLKGHLYETRPLTLARCPALKLTARAGEAEGEFAIRVREGAREARDVALDKMRKKWVPKLRRMKDKIDTAERAIDREQSQYEEERAENTVSWGSTLLGALFGRKLGSASNVRSAASAAKGRARVNKQAEDVEHAKEKHAHYEQQFAELQREFDDELDRVREEFEPDRFELEEKVLRLRKADLVVDGIGLAWLPERI